MKILAGAAICGALIMAACTTTEKVSVQQPGDRSMSCAELRTEMDKLDGIVKDAQSDQGVNGANVAGVLFFWPAAVGNWMSADEAKDLAMERKNHLMSIWNDNGCEGRADLKVQVPAELLSPIAQGMH